MHTMRPWMLSMALGIALLSAPRAQADVPQQIINQIADLRVQQDELRHLAAIGKLTDRDAFAKKGAMEAQIDTLWLPYRALPRAEDTRARTAIDRLVTDKVSLLRPQWTQEESAFKMAREQRAKRLYDEAEDDARHAAELQRQRVALRKELAAGTLAHDAFDAKDKQASDGIAAFRKKYDAEGERWPNWFDQRYRFMLETALKNPDTPLPQTSVPVASPGPATLADVPADLKIAADLAVKREENRYKFDKKQIDEALMVSTEIVIDRDLARLTARYDALVPKEGEDFVAAYRRKAAPRIQDLKAQYYPDQYRPRTAAASAPIPTSVPAQGYFQFAFDALGLMRNIVIGIILFVIVMVVIGMMFGRGAAADPGPPLSDNYGSASYAPFQSEPRSGDITAHGVFLGKSSAPNRQGSGITGLGAPIVTTPEHHTLIVARTRTGKGTRVIIPTLLRYGGNAFVIDPKGENAAITARTRGTVMKQAVHVLNPWGVMAKLYEGFGIAPATYNPLDILDRNDPNAVATARRLARAISPVAGRGDDAFWQQSAANILAAVFLWLADQPGEAKTLARAREIITLDRKRFTDQYLVKMAASTVYQGAIREIVGNLLDLADNTYTGINASLTLATDFISDPQLKRATNSSTFTMADLRDSPTTIFLVIPPDEVETQKTWLRLMIAAATHSFRRPVSTTPARRCMMLIDEFPALGKLQDLPTDIATMAGYGLDYTLIVQGIDQLKAVYDKDSGAILSNCAYKWYCNITDLEGAKHVSESLGEATVRTIGHSRSSGSTGDKSSSGESTTYGEKARKLLTPDEIINLGRDAAVVFQPEGLPLYVRPIDYWNLTRAFGHLELMYGGLYWKPPLTYDENPYFKQESRPGMSRAQALNVFGLSDPATKNAVTMRYGSMMKQLQPGEDDIARQINTARAVLLGE